MKAEGNKNKQTEYTKELVKEIPIGNVWRQETNATAWSGQWERTGLDRICDVEIGYQISGMNEFRYKDSFRFVFSIFIL